MADDLRPYGAEEETFLERIAIEDEFLVDYHQPEAKRTSIE